MISKWREFLSGRTASKLEEQVSERLYQLSLAHSRNPQFYIEFEVKDTLDGRFDSLCLSLAVLLHRLAICEEEYQEQAKENSQQIFDIFCADMDLTLREMGVGDLGVAKRVKKMSEAFLGRLKAYREALDKGDIDALAEALKRNLFRNQQTGSQPEKLAKAIHHSVTQAALQKDENLLSAEFALQPITLAK